MDQRALHEEIAVMSEGAMRDLALMLRSVHASAAGDLAWGWATADVSQVLRLSDATATAAVVSHAASNAVTQRAGELGIDLPDPDVTIVARAAGDVARALVAGDRFAEPFIAALTRVPTGRGVR